MAGTATVTSTRNWRIPSDGVINLFTIHWTTTSGGALSVQLADGSGDVIQFNGTLLQAVFEPDAEAAPSDAYDLTITGNGSVDVLVGIGANLSNSAGKRETPVTSTNSIPIILAEALTLNGSNIGNSKSGYVYLYVR